MNINELSNLVFYKMENYSQITIDLVSDVEDLLLEEDISSDKIGALSYEISILIDVINPTLKDDIVVLNNLYHELELISTEKVHKLLIEKNKEQPKIKLISVRTPYLVKFVDPNKKYPVSYTIQNGKRIDEPTNLLGCDLTEKQIIELFEKELL
jgi:hypothetical protein